jgi:hypothetical protein
VPAGGSVGASGSGSVEVGGGSLGVGPGLVGEVVGVAVGASLDGFGLGFERSGDVALRVEVSVILRTGRSSAGTEGTGWVEVGVGVATGCGAWGMGAPSTAASACRPPGVEYPFATWSPMTLTNAAATAIDAVMAARLRERLRRTGGMVRVMTAGRTVGALPAARRRICTTSAAAGRRAGSSATQASYSRMISRGSPAMPGSRGARRW